MLPESDDLHAGHVARSHAVGFERNIDTLERRSGVHQAHRRVLRLLRGGAVNWVVSTPLGTSAI
jgi:hypothetical protein